MVKVKQFVLETPALLRETACHMGSHRVCPPPNRSSISRPYPGQYSIYPPIKDERLSRRKPTQVNDFPGVATERLPWITFLWSAGDTGKKTTANT